MDAHTQGVLDHLMLRIGALTQDCANSAGDLAVARARIAELEAKVVELTPKTEPQPETPKE